MKIAPSQQSFRRNKLTSNRGFTILEVTISAAISAISIAVLLWVSAEFFGSRLGIQTMMANLRSQTDEIGITLDRAAKAGHRGFMYQGRVLNPDGTVYIGSKITLSKPLCQVYDSSDFLAAAGLTLSAQAGEDRQTAIIVGDDSEPQVILRGSSLRSDNWTAFYLEYYGKPMRRRIDLAAPPYTTAPRLAAAVGSIATAADGHVQVTMPNPLALLAASLPSYRNGLVIDLPNAVTRARP